MISEQIVRVANTPCLLLSDRSEVRILLGVPKSAWFSEKARKTRHFLIFSYFGDKLILQGNGAVVWASDSKKEFCASAVSEMEH